MKLYMFKFRHDLDQCRANPELGFDLIPDSYINTNKSLMVTSALQHFSILACYEVVLFFKCFVSDALCLTHHFFVFAALL